MARRVRDTSFLRKLAWFTRGTKHQQARPREVRIDEQQLAADVQAEVIRQFEQAKNEKRLRLDLRPLFRRAGRAAILGILDQPVARKKRPDGKDTGGSLTKEIKRSLSVRQWGFVLKLGSTLGLRAVVRGIKLAEEQLRKIALTRLQSETSGAQLERELRELERVARQLERAEREAKVQAYLNRQAASRGR